MTPVYIVASLWIQEGRAAEFEAYERKAVRILQRYGGLLERVVRLAESGSSGQPFEIHLLRFPGQQTFEAYQADVELKALAAERASVITKTLISVGAEGPVYAA